MTINNPMFNNVVGVIKSAGKYVSLNISGNALTNIPDNAFFDNVNACETLVSITIPNSVTRIGEEAFAVCTNLISVTIPNSVISIGEGAFNSTSLNSITIPSSVTSIGDYVFIGCKNLTAINVDNGNNAYSSQDGVLYNKTKSTLIQYPAGKTTATFTIPNSVTNIGNNAFRLCANLINVTIPNSVTSIDYYAFADCTKLASVTIPDSVTSIESFTFANCANLTSVTIGNSVKSIGGGAFYNCEILMRITIPESVTSINTYYEGGGTGAEITAFQGCTRLTSVTFQGKIAPNNFGDYMEFTKWSKYWASPFLGDLRDKYLKGGIGTYTTTSPVDYQSKWTKR